MASVLTTMILKDDDQAFAPSPRKPKVGDTVRTDSGKTGKVVRSKGPYHTVMTPNPKGGLFSQHHESKLTVVNKGGPGSGPSPGGASLVTAENNVVRAHMEAAQAHQAAADQHAQRARATSNAKVNRENALAAKYHSNKSKQHQALAQLYAN